MADKTDLGSVAIRRLGSNPSGATIKKSPRVGIGIRNGFKIRRSQEIAGSNPVAGTTSEVGRVWLIAVDLKSTGGDEPPYGSNP